MSHRASVLWNQFWETLGWKTQILVGAPSVYLKHVCPGSRVTHLAGLSWPERARRATPAFLGTRPGRVPGEGGHPRTAASPSESGGALPVSWFWAAFLSLVRVSGSLPDASGPSFSSLEAAL